MTTLKKQMERRFLDAARALSNVFPEGGISEGERPDFVIHGNQGKIGIEVTRLFRPKGASDFPIQQAEILAG